MPDETAAEPRFSEGYSPELEAALAGSDGGRARGRRAAPAARSRRRGRRARARDLAHGLLDAPRPCAPQARGRDRRSCSRLRHVTSTWSTRCSMAARCSRTRSAWPRCSTSCALHRRRAAARAAHGGRRTARRPPAPRAPVGCLSQPPRRARRRERAARRLRDRRSSVRSRSRPADTHVTGRPPDREPRRDCEQPAVAPQSSPSGPRPPVPEAPDSPRRAASPLAAPSPSSRLQDYQAWMRLRVSGTHAALAGRPARDQPDARLRRLRDALRRERAGRTHGTAEVDVHIPIARVQDAIARFSSLGVIVGQHVAVADLQAGYDAAQRRAESLRHSLALIEVRLADPKVTPEQRVALLAQRERARHALAGANETSTSGCGSRRLRASRPRVLDGSEGRAGRAAEARPPRAGGSPGRRDARDGRDRRDLRADPRRARAAARRTGRPGGACAAGGAASARCSRGRELSPNGPVSMAPCRASLR